MICPTFLLGLGTALEVSGFLTNVFLIMEVKFLSLDIVNKILTDRQQIHSHHKGLLFSILENTCFEQTFIGQDGSLNSNIHYFLNS